jgi:hypothetical protein
MKRVCIGDKFYTVEFVSPESVEGDCGNQEDGREGWGGRIFINNNLRGHMLLDTALHEPLHVLCPWMDEEEVKRIGTCLASYQIQLGLVREEDLCPERLTSQT